MTQDEFNKKYNEPVDLVEAHAALNRFINGKGILRIPASPDDDDMLISRALTELKNMRAKYMKDEVYIVQGKSGIVFSATTDYEKALSVKNDLNASEHDKGKMGHWENNKHLFQE